MQVRPAHCNSTSQKAIPILLPQPINSLNPTQLLYIPLHSSRFTKPAKLPFPTSTKTVTHRHRPWAAPVGAAPPRCVPTSQRRDAGGPRTWEQRSRAVPDSGNSWSGGGSFLIFSPSTFWGGRAYIVSISDGMNPNPGFWVPLLANERSARSKDPMDLKDWDVHGERNRLGGRGANTIFSLFFWCFISLGDRLVPYGCLKR